MNVAPHRLVAAEITKHGGVAICAPRIAPYAATREWVHRQVASTATSCSCTPPRRCRCARCGTGRGSTRLRERDGSLCLPVSATRTEEPTDADLTLDTTDRSIELMC